MRETLHEDDELTIRLIADDSGARVELESAQGGPDLSADDEVVVAVDGRVCPLEVESARRAQAVLDDDSDESPTFTLMVRVHEFFEGWEFFDE